MGNLFGIRRRIPVVEVTAQDRAILQLKQQRDKIKIYQGKVEAQLETERKLALKLLQNGMKDRALVILRKKHAMEDTLKRTDDQLSTLEKLTYDIEFSQIQLSVVEGLKVGNEALKQLNSIMSVENLQQILEDSQEAADKQREITALLSGNYSDNYDDDELTEELNEMARAQKEAENIKKPEPEIVSEKPSPISIPLDTEVSKSSSVPSSIQNQEAIPLSISVEPSDGALEKLDRISVPDHEPDSEQESLDESNSTEPVKKKRRQKLAAE